MRLGPANLISGVSNNHRRICFINYAVNPRHNRNPLFGLPRSEMFPLGYADAMHKQKQVITVLLHANRTGRHGWDFIIHRQTSPIIMHEWVAAT
jgi:hypothetical protein